VLRFTVSGAWQFIKNRENIAIKISFFMGAVYCAPPYFARLTGHYLVRN